MKLLALILVPVAVLAAYFVYRLFITRPSKPTADQPAKTIPMQIGDFVVVTASESRERVKRIGLPDQGSENVQDLLVAPPLEPVPLERANYRPDDSSEWIVDIEFVNEPILKQTDLAIQFGGEWRKKNGNPDVYGWSPDAKQWTYLVAAGVPPTFTKLCFGWRLVDPLDEELEIKASDLERYEQAVIDTAKSFGSPKAITNRSSEAAAELAVRLKRLVEDCQRDVIVVLVAPPQKPFDGLEVWDVMKCLGLKWGDGDYFHWENRSRNGDDSFFSVGTSTPPGYFLPEQIAAGEVKVGDLVFAYSLPRSAVPEQVFDSMLRAVRYAQKRLGGTVQDGHKKPLDEAVIREQIRSTVEKLQQAGFKPGADATLYVF